MSDRWIPVELALAVKELWSRKRLLLLGIVISAAAAFLSIYRVSLLPFHYEKRGLVYSGAYTQALVDSPHSFLGNSSMQIQPLITRATIYANVMASPAVLSLIGKDAGIPMDQIWAAGPIDPSLQRTVIEPTATKRNLQVAGEPDPYRLEFLADPNLPTIGIYAQAPTTTQAVALANASVKAISSYVDGIQQQQKDQRAVRVSIRQIGQAWGTVVDAGIVKKLAGLVFVLSFGAWCIIVMVALRARRALGGAGARLQRTTPGGESGPPAPFGLDPETDAWAPADTGGDASYGDQPVGSDGTFGREPARL